MNVSHFIYGVLFFAALLSVDVICTLLPIAARSNIAAVMLVSGLLFVVFAWALDGWRARLAFFGVGAGFIVAARDVLMRAEYLNQLLDLFVRGVSFFIT